MGATRTRRTHGRGDREACRMIRAIVSTAIIGACSSGRTVASPIEITTSNFSVNGMIVNVATTNARRQSARPSEQCETQHAWDSALVAPIVSFISTKVLKPSERIIGVDFLERFDDPVHLDSSSSRTERRAPNEVSLEIRPRSASVYRYSETRFYCIIVRIRDSGILVNLDLAATSEVDRLVD
jgi:hypothetical protein